MYHLIGKDISCCLWHLRSWLCAHKLVWGLLIKIMTSGLEEEFTASLCATHTLIDR